MKIVNLDASAATSIVQYDSRLAAAVTVAHGHGDAHVYVVTFEPGGSIGAHEAGFGQLFIPMSGDGWIAGASGDRVRISPDTAGYIVKGETHSKGSDTGMTALMIQVDDLSALEELFVPS